MRGRGGSAAPGHGRVTTIAPLLRHEGKHVVFHRRRRRKSGNLYFSACSRVLSPPPRPNEPSTRDVGLIPTQSLPVASPKCRKQPSISPPPRSQSAVKRAPE